jgi:hypothetical protein
MKETDGMQRAAIETRRRRRRNECMMEEVEKGGNGVAVFSRGVEEQKNIELMRAAPGRTTVSEIGDDERGKEWLNKSENSAGKECGCTLLYTAA